MGNLISSDGRFTAAQKAQLQEIVGYMIPAHGDQPGAGDDLIFGEILQALQPQADVIYEVLELYAAADLQALSALRNPALSTLVATTVQCYYRDDRVLEALNVGARAPHPQVYSLEQGDFSRLEPVRSRGKIYRDV